MNAQELKRMLHEGGLEKYSALYQNVRAEGDRLIKAIDSFTELYGDGRELYIFSVPGRSEISGNHTDHNNGCVLAGAIDRDIIAIVAKNDDNVIRFSSEGYPEDVVSLMDTVDPSKFEKYTSAALIAGVANAFREHGLDIGGYDAYSNTEVLKGSGISSSAAYEVMIGNILNYLYNDGRVDNKDIAKFSQYAENVYFGKPCGLMDQMACAVGGFVYIDFENPAQPRVEPINFSLAAEGYALCIVNTGGNHANLNDDYASVPGEMKALAAKLGRGVLRGLTEEELIAKIPEIREEVGDRAILRALHFLRENGRVEKAREALIGRDVDAFFDVISASGASSFKFLQNVYTTLNVREQGLSLALAITEGFLDGKRGAARVHGGGFAGTIQVFLERTELRAYIELMDSVFGRGSAMPLNIRPVGATRLF
ncbi:MAG: galactokinase [Clostridia bacterium]|nr:galactokinase [Clostridia bacterium]